MRLDPIVGRKVLIAEDRAKRPNDYSPIVFAGESFASSGATAGACPFCAGHEHQTPPSLVEMLDEQGRWQVRVVANKFPAVSGSPAENPAENLPGDFQPRPVESVLPAPQQALGVQEVVIESPQHVRDFSDLSLHQVAAVLQVYRERLRHWADEGRLRHALAFKNVGLAAGASLEHIHGQLMALPYVPTAVAEELAGAGRYYDRRGKCVFCQLVQEEFQQRVRLVAEEGPFVAFCAYAGRQPYETWILPTAHAPRFERLTDQESMSLAKIFQQVLGRLGHQLSPLSYNLILHTSPFQGDCEDYYHWHWELIPRTCPLAGLEWGAGVFINPLSPEQAARLLQKVKI